MHRPRRRCPGGSIGAAFLFPLVLGGVSPLPGGWAGELEAQMLDPIPLDFSLAGDVAGVRSFWSNPAALSAGAEDALLGAVSLVPRPGVDESGFGQALVGLRTGGLGAGIRRERFHPGAGEEPVMGTGITVAFGGAYRGLHVGVATEQYRRGVQDSRWEVGAMWRPAPEVTLGAVWRDIGSPVIISQERVQSLALGGTIQVPDGSGSLSYEAQLPDGAPIRHRGFARANLRGLDVLGGVELITNDGIQRIFLGVGYRLGANRGFGVRERIRDSVFGDASGYSFGAERRLSGPDS